MGINISTELFKSVNVSAPSDADVCRILQEGVRHPPMTNVSHFDVGDVVKIIDNIVKVKGLQEGHGGWISTMSSILGKTGIVKLALLGGDLVVSLLGKNLVLNPECCSRVPESEKVGNEGNAESMMEMMERFPSMAADFRRFLQSTQNDREVPERQNEQFDIGERVKIIEDAEKVKAYQNGYGGWVDDMASVLGRDAEVQMVLPTGSLLVTTSDRMCSLNPKCCQKVSPYMDDTDRIWKSIEKTMGKFCHESFESAVFDEFVKGAAKCHIQDEFSVSATALHNAITEENEVSIDNLIRDPKIDLTKPNEFGFNALHQAAITGNNFATKRILQKCRDIVNIKSDDGFSALHLAALHGHQEVVNTLLTEGQAQVDIRNRNQQTPFHLAVAQNHISLTELLISKGANINAKDEDGNICLHLANLRQNVSISTEDSEMLENIHIQLNFDEDKPVGMVLACYLVLLGADFYHKNKQGITISDTISDQSLIEKMVELASMLLTKQPNEVQIEEPISNTIECLLCSDKQATILFQPCSHVLICDDCNQKNMIKNCFKCQVPIAEKITIQDAEEKRNMELIEKFTCQVCKNQPCNVAFNCGHTICKECAGRLKECHMCREPIQKVLDLY